MNPALIPVLIQIALQAFRLVAARTKSKLDDQIAEGLDRSLNVLLSRPQIDAWAIANMLLATARYYAETTARTGDDKLAAEFQAVAAALEPVIGNEVWAAQLRDVVIDWPYLDAPGVAKT